MLERQYLTRRGGVRVVYPECQTTQYILPCFVASYLELHKDPSVDQDKKKEFLLFVHNLVESYETQEFCQEVVFRKSQTPLNSDASSPRFMIMKICLTKENVAWTLNNILAGSKVYDVLYKTPSVMSFKCTYDLLDFLPTWLQQISMIFSRMITNCVKNFSTADCRALGAIVQFMIFLFDCEASSIVDLSENCRQLLLPFRKLQKPFKTALSVFPLFGITAFHFFNSLKRDEFREKMRSTQGPGFPLDEIDSAMWALYSGDLWTVKQKLSSMAHLRGQHDPTLVTLEFARSNVFYEEVLKSGLTEEEKVKMSRPGEITFFPVVHCRWCGLLEAEILKKCQVCVDNPDFPDVHYFCSLKCETEALDQQHTEEHATFLMIRCGIISM